MEKLNKWIIGGLLTLIVLLASGGFLVTQAEFRIYQEAQRDLHVDMHHSLERIEDKIDRLN